MHRHAYRPGISGAIFGAVALSADLLGLEPMRHGCYGPGMGRWHLGMAQGVCAGPRRRATDSERYENALNTTPDVVSRSRNTKSVQMSSQAQDLPRTPSPGPSGDYFGLAEEASLTTGR